MSWPCWGVGRTSLELDHTTLPSYVLHGKWSNRRRLPVGMYFRFRSALISGLTSGSRKHRPSALVEARSPPLPFLARTGPFARRAVIRSNSVSRPSPVRERKASEREPKSTPCRHSP